MLTASLRRGNATHPGSAEEEAEAPAGDLNSRLS